MQKVSELWKGNLIETLIYQLIYKSNHKMFFELSKNLINTGKLKELDVNASEYEKINNNY